MEPLLIGIANLNDNAEIINTKTPWIALAIARDHSVLESNSLMLTSTTTTFSPTAFLKHENHVKSRTIGVVNGVIEVLDSKGEKELNQLESELFQGPHPYTMCDWKSLLVKLGDAKFNPLTGEISNLSPHQFGNVLILVIALFVVGIFVLISIC